MAAQDARVEVAQVLLDAGANNEAQDEVRAKRGGEGGGGGGENWDRVSYFLRVLLTGFGEPSNLEYGREYMSSCPERNFETVVVEGRVLYNGGCKTKGQGVIVSVISCISHGDWRINETCVPQLLG